MAFKFVLFIASAVFATANAGLTVTSGSDNTYRSPGNLAQISTQSKTIDTPYSSSSKSDVRVSNPSVYLSAQPALSYSAQPAHVYASAAAPANYYDNHYAKVAYATAPQATVNYATPFAHAAPTYYPQNYATQAVYPAGHQQVYASAPSAVVTKTAYAAPAAYHVAQHAPVALASPAATYTHAAPAYAPAHQQLVKVSWSPANEVAHFTYNNVNDHIAYAW